MRIISFTIVVALVDLITTIFVPLGIEDFNMKDWWSDQLHYSFINSFIDMQVLNIIRIALIAVTCKQASQGSAMVQMNGKIQHERYSTLTFKLCAACAAISLIKAIVTMGAQEGGTLVWLPSFIALVMCISECCCIWVLWKTIGRCARSNLYEKLLSESEDHDVEASYLKEKKFRLVKLLTILKPYFWPGNTEPQFIINRIRACSTYIIVIVSKVLGVISPLFLGNATTALTLGDYRACLLGLFWFTATGLVSKILRECQLLVYLRVKQAAYIELAMSSFTHIHKLSLQWHLKKKLGNVMRSMDRGNVAADNLVTYLFLFLVPCLLEIVMTISIFFLKFSDWRLGVMILFAMWIYIFTTMKLTRWRMGFREKTNVQDNEYHDKATDSIINYETVKYFTNEENECKWFKDSIVDYIYFSTNVQISLSVLNMVQAAIVTLTLGLGLVLGARSVNAGLYEVGQLLSINVYLNNIFVPLTFLGTVYNIIVQAFVDMGSLTDLLTENPDVLDVPGAKALELPPENSSGISVEFRNVSFCYPGQPPERGLKDLNIMIAPGSTTALVSLSRLRTSDLTLTLALVSFFIFILFTSLGFPYCIFTFC